MNPSREKPTILVVDDSVGNLKLAESALKDEFKPVLLTSGEQALRFLQKIRPDLIILDVQMPAMDGYETLKQIKNNPNLKDIPVIFFSSLSDDQSELVGLEYGAADYIAKPVIPRLLLHRIRMQLELYDHRHRLEYLVQEKTSQVVQLQKATIHSLAGLSECRHQETGQHIKRTVRYVEILVAGIRESQYELLDEETAEHIIHSAPLHDIGKIGIPDSILGKPDRLTQEEFEIMKQHVAIGEATLRKTRDELGFKSFLDTALEMCATHHERWDGTGYLKGLSGTDIPLAGRIMAVADVYDALVTKRVYKDAMDHQKAVEIIRQGSGTHFDPTLVEIFLQQENAFRAIMEKYND